MFLLYLNIRLWHIPVSYILKGTCPFEYQGVTSSCVIHYEGYMSLWISGCDIFMCYTIWRVHVSLNFVALYLHVLLYRRKGACPLEYSGVSWSHSTPLKGQKGHWCCYMLHVHWTWGPPLNIGQQPNYFYKIIYVKQMCISDDISYWGYWLTIQFWINVGLLYNIDQHFMFTLIHTYCSIIGSYITNKTHLHNMPTTPDSDWQ